MPQNLEEPAEAEEWIQVGRYATVEQAYDHGLVILAMGEACRVAEAETPGEFDLQAEAGPASAKISRELDLYRDETSAPLPRPLMTSDWARHSPGGTLCALWTLLLLVAFWWQDQDPEIVDRLASSSTGLLGRGEWWRPFTALFLHADLPHLVGNLASGWVFATLAARMIGPALGWALILACGTMGNAITSWLTFPQPFSSIGASTAVFAALGIMSGAGLAETMLERGRMPWLRIAAPPLAGLILLGWLGGTNDGNTDVLGHVFGFSSGLAGGAVAGVFERRHAPGHG